jgi:hypothetical protein
VARSYGLSMHGDEFPHFPALGDEGDAEPRRLLSIKNTARVLGDITTREVYNRIKAGDLEAVPLGRRRMVVAESVDAYVARLREQARQPEAVAI